jgi:hypothetical protein
VDGPIRSSRQRARSRRLPEPVDVADLRLVVLDRPSQDRAIQANPAGALVSTTQWSSVSAP